MLINKLLFYCVCLFHLCHMLPRTQIKSSSTQPLAGRAEVPSQQAPVLVVCVCSQGLLVSCWFSLFSLLTRWDKHKSFLVCANLPSLNTSGFEAFQ